MTGYYGELERGKPVYHNGVEKMVKDWHFTEDVNSPGMPNSDMIVIYFEDGTTTGEEGFSKIEYKPEPTFLVIPATYIDDRIVNLNISAAASTEHCDKIACERVIEELMDLINMYKTDKK